MKKELIKLGYTNPKLRKHLRPILDGLYKKDPTKIGSRANSDNIALLIGYRPSFVLYDVTKVQELVRDEDLFWEEMEDAIVGFGEMKEANCKKGLYVVERTAALKGYGPLLYDIMLSYAREEGKLGIIPDRKRVSSAARYVWSYYYTNRKDVGHTLDENCRSWDDDVLDAYYFIKKPLNLSNLERNHEVAKDMAIENDIIEGNLGVFESHLEEVANDFASDLL